jgi:hypothetical protein
MSNIANILQAGAALSFTEVCFNAILTIFFCVIMSNNKK